MKKRLLSGLCALMLLILYVPLPLEAQAATQKLGQLPIGSVVKIIENKVLTDFILIQHGYPDIGDGKELLLRAEAVTGPAYQTVTPILTNWNGNNCFVYKTSNAEKWINETWVNLLEPVIREEIITVPVISGSIAGVTWNSDLKAFALSAIQLGAQDGFYIGHRDYVFSYAYNPENNYIGYFSNNNNRASFNKSSYYVRGTTTTSKTNSFAINSQGGFTGVDSITQYRPAFCLPSDMFVTADGRVTVDADPPVISDITVPAEWSKQIIIDIPATDADSGVAEYAISQESTAPSTGWQASSKFNILQNGTYYAFAKDGAGNISAPKEFTVSTLDADKPVISSVHIPADWGAKVTVRIDATDTGSGIEKLAVSKTNVAPYLGWQESSFFEITENGTCYAWARDVATNISVSYPFVVDKIDAIAPTIANVTVSSSWGADNEATIYASDVGTGVDAYAVAGSSAPPAEGWQSGNKFAMADNGSYYAFARDTVGNVSQPKYFSVSFVDKSPPKITSTYFNSSGTTVTVTASDNESGVASITVDAETKSGSYATFSLAEGTRYIDVKATDRAGRESEPQTVRVPGWYDELNTLTLLPVEFTNNNSTAVITAQSEGAAVAGISVNNKYTAKNPLTYTIPASEKYLELQARDINGDRSAVYRVRVPGWSEQLDTIAITQVTFSEDVTAATITATETVGKGVAGIYVNGEFIEGNPVHYSIAEGTRHLEMQAQNNEGDRSRVLTRRVPGWSEVVTTLAITDVAFQNYNTMAQITAVASGGDTVAGIYVNEEFSAGNPVIYKIPKNTDTLNIYAVNTNGDKSSAVTKAVPRDSSKSTLKVSIDKPSWTNKDRVKIRITATDKSPVVSVMARTAEDEEWSDVTDSRYIYIKEDTTVYASAENEQGDVKEASLDIVCFDRELPTVTAIQDGDVINIRTNDDKSGIDAIIVNNKEYRDSSIYGGKLTWTIPQGTTNVVIKAQDKAGNLTQPLELGVRMTVTAVPAIISPTPQPTPPPEPQEVTLPEPEPTPEPVEEDEEEVIPAVGMVSNEKTPLEKAAIPAAIGVGSSATALGLYFYRKHQIAKLLPEIDLVGKRLEYDESEFKGVYESKAIEVDFKHKVS